MLEDEVKIKGSLRSGAVRIVLELECPPETESRSALLRFNFAAPLATTEGTGLLLSANSRAGYFRYVETRSGRFTTELTVILPPEAECLSVVLVAWSAAGRKIVLNSVLLEQVEFGASSPNAMFKSFRNVARFDCDKFSYPSPEVFLASQRLEPGLHVIDCGGLPLEIMYTPKNVATTTIVFNAALSVATQEIPRFMAGPIFADQHSSTISVFDASLYNDDSLMLAWYAGSRRFRMQEILPRLLRKFVSHAGGSRTLLFGASGGGFAAIYYAQFFRDSIVIAMNPQTIIENYIPRIVEAYGKQCWGSDSPHTLRRVLQEEIVSDLRLLSLDQTPFSLVYVQNSADGHVEEHLIPFCSALPNEDRIHLVLDHWGVGHVSPPRKLVATLLSTIIDDAVGWEQGIAALGARKAPEVEGIRNKVRASESNHSVGSSVS